ncbi:MAG: hypothetical protein ACNA7W_17135 [Pseudomonadales bacterium]
MSGIFATLGLLLGGYTAYAAFSGAVFAKHRAWGRTITRGEEPARFWLTIAIYVGLTLALLFYF